jgi:drug/metabolite transporter (DMT)-like permease
MKQQLLATLLVVGGAFGWAVRDLVSKSLGKHVSPWLTLAATSAGGLIINTAVLAGKQCAGFGCSDRLRPRAQLWLAARASGAFTSILLNFMALQHLDLAISSMIHCTSPLFVVLLGNLLLGEQIKPLAGAYVVVALLGLVLDVQPWSAMGGTTGNGSILGYVFALGSSIAAGFSYTSLRALADLTSTTTLMAMYCFCLTAGLIALMVTGVEATSGDVMIHFAGITVVTYVSEVLITKGYALATQGAGSVAVYKFLTPIFALVFGMVFYSEIPNALNLLGACVVVGSSALMVHTQAKAKHVEPVSKGDPEKGEAANDAAPVTNDETVADAH